MKKGQLSVIEITDDRIRVLTGRIQKTGPLISEFRAAAVNTRDPRELGRQLSALVSPKDMDDDNVILSIPRRHAILKHFVLPSQSTEELRRMIGLQIAGHVPFSRDNIVFDILPLERLDDGSTRILVIVVPQDVIQRKLEAIQRTGVLPHTVLVNSLGVAGWYASKYASSAAKTDGAAVVIHIDDKNSEVCLCFQDKLVFSRNITFGSADLQAGKVEGFVEQIDLTLGAYKKESMGPAVKAMIVAGGASAGKMLGEKLQEIYRVPITVEDALAGINLEKGFNPTALKNDSSGSVLPLAGLLTEPWPKPVNFMPADILYSKARRLRKSALVRLALSGVLTLALAVGVLAVPVYEDGRYLAGIESQLEDLKPLSARAQKKTEFLNFVKSEVENRVTVVDVIKEFYRIFPQDASLKGLSLDRTGTIIIEGLAQSGSEVNVLQSGLVNSPLFQEVNLQYATKRRRFRQEYTDFKIICRLAGRSETRR